VRRRVSNQTAPTEVRSHAIVLDWTFAVWALLTLVLSAALPPPPLTDHSWAITAFLSLTAVVLGTAIITLEYGSINMAGVATCTAIAVLWPAQAAIVAWFGGGYFAWQRRRRSHVPNNFSQSVWAASGAVAHRLSENLGAAPTVAIAIGFAVGFLVNLATTSVVISLVTHDPARQILRRTLNLSFAAVFGYFALAGALSASLVFNGIPGMVQVLCLFLLGVPVADSVGGRRIRSFLERQLMSVDQQVQYGELARGTIHNVRNSIAVALANLDDLGTLAGPKESSALAAIKVSLEETRQALGDAVSSAAASSLTFSRVELGELARQTAELLRAAAHDRGIVIMVKSHDYPVYVFGHPGLLRELLTNLILNSLDASTSGALVTIAYQHGPEEVSLTVEDAGQGISEASLRRIFEPGFSTKGSRGTGLGLYTSLGIARQHGGDLQVSAPQPAGTMFILRLPPYDEGSSRFGASG
jgi:signal transduction histidine kinase